MTKSMLRIAAAQTPGNRLDQWHEAAEAIALAVKQAAAVSAELVLLPECVWPAYFIGSVEAYFQALAQGMPNDQSFLQTLRELARRHDIAICAGCVAEHGDQLTNDVVLISAAGEILGRHSKCFLWDFDNEFFLAGKTLTPVPTSWGPTGLMICADARLPEIPATLVARGARLILQPTAWVNVGTPERLWNPQPALLIPERAREFGVPVVSASKWGVEGDTTFVGSSLICDARGRVLKQCGTSATELITAEISLEKRDGVQLESVLRERLLSPLPVKPVDRGAHPLRVVRLSASARQDRLVSALPTLQKAPDWTPTLFLTRGAEAAIASDAWLMLSKPTNAIQDCGGVRLAALSDLQANSFAAGRAAALDGVHAAIVFGDRISAKTLRCRAVENRIFIVHVASSAVHAYDPKGEALQPTALRTPELPALTDEALALVLQSEQAADKNFAPDTNPFQQRCPQSYEF